MLLVVLLVVLLLLLVLLAQVLPQPPRRRRRHRRRAWPQPHQQVHPRGGQRQEEVRPQLPREDGEHLRMLPHHGLQQPWGV